MTQLCTIAIQSSREVTQPRENEGPVKPPFFCLLRVTEFGSSPAPMQAKRRVAAAAAFLRVSGNRVSFGPSDLVCARFQSGSILDKLLFVPPPPRHLLPAVPLLFWCAFRCLLFIRSRADRLSRSARLRNMNRLRKLASARDFVSTRCHPENLERTIKVTSRRSTSA